MENTVNFFGWCLAPLKRTHVSDPSVESALFLPGPPENIANILLTNFQRFMYRSKIHIPPSLLL
jgi:hypothetical protein